MDTIQGNHQAIVILEIDTDDLSIDADNVLMLFVMNDGSVLATENSVMNHMNAFTMQQIIEGYGYTRHAYNPRIIVYVAPGRDDVVVDDVVHAVEQIITSPPDGYVANE